jgi:hypothetical protein
MESIGDIGGGGTGLLSAADLDVVWLGSCGVSSGTSVTSHARPNDSPFDYQ